MKMKLSFHHSLCFLPKPQCQFWRILLLRVICSKYFILTSVWFSNFPSSSLSLSVFPIIPKELVSPNCQQWHQKNLTATLGCLWTEIKINNLKLENRKILKIILKYSDRNDAHEITAYWKYIFHRKSLSQINISELFSCDAIFSLHH